jgi:hypothetical protein
MMFPEVTRPRIYSKYLALQIKAAEEGLIPARTVPTGIMEGSEVASLRADA